MVGLVIVKLNDYFVELKWIRMIYWYLLTIDTDISVGIHLCVAWSGCNGLGVNVKLMPLNRN